MPTSERNRCLISITEEKFPFIRIQNVGSTGYDGSAIKNAVPVK